ncbi:MAG: hypothetical protein KAU50_11790, partial [Candidatus Marinimicrobia bacterium]|nr:hypothetical protein [Candidatus Neomarinimicrobiota bacterium]
EHGHANEQTIDMSTTAYWYQKEPHRKFPVILKSSMRIPLRHVVPNGMVEAESLQPTGSGFKASVVDMSDHGPEWSGHSQLLIEPEKAGKSAEIVIDNAIERAYDVHLYYTTGQEYGNVDIYHGNKKVGSFSGYSEQVLPGNRVVLENIATRDGTLPLKIAITGKEADASGYAAGLDGFLLVPKREYVPEWYMIGPFPNPRESDILRYGLDNVYPPEKEFNLAETYEGAEGQTVKWKLYKIGDNGFMSLWDKVKPYEFVVVYALTYVYSPDDREATLLIGTDDGAKVFLNGEELYRFLDVRIAGPDQDEVTLPLKAGWNQLLLKIENNFGGYGFFARVRDTSRSLKISVNKK